MIQQFHLWRNSTSDKNSDLQNICTPIFNAVLFIIGKIWKQVKCLLIDKWIKEVVHIFNWNMSHKRE